MIYFMIPSLKNFAATSKDSSMPEEFEYLLAVLLMILSGFLPISAESQDYGSPSRQADYPEWNEPAYLAANSAQNEDYLTDKEKKVYYYLNLVRMNPKLFADTYLAYLKNSTDD